MALYLIGDVQGCDTALQQLLEKISFSPSRDTAYLLGDLVNRGPQSAQVLRRLMRYGAGVQCVLGNHDLHLLAVAAHVRKPSHQDTLADVLQAPERTAMLEWLRAQPLARRLQVGNQDVLLVHAGVLPSWSADQTLALAAEVQTQLRGPQWRDLLAAMYGDTPTAWDEQLSGMARLRVIVNALTRLRFCDAQGRMQWHSKGDASTAPAGFMPWFDAPNRQTAAQVVAFGHWSTLGWLARNDVIAMDSGCVWGGCLSAWRLDDANQGALGSLVQVRCPKAQTP